MSDPLVVAAIADDECCAHVRAVLVPWTTVRFVPTIRVLSKELGFKAPDVVLWHLGTIGDIDDECVMALHHVRRRWTETAVVAYCQVSVPTAPLLVAAGRVGVDRLLLRGHDDLRDAIRHELRDRGVGIASRDVMARLDLPRSAASRVLEHCVSRVTATALTVDQLANDLGVHRKTVRNWLRAGGLPSPERVIGWSRLLVAASLLHAPHRTIASVSTCLSFASESALRGMLMRYTGMTPRDLRQSDGFERLVCAFRGATEHSDAHARESLPDATRNSPLSAGRCPVRAG